MTNTKKHFLGEKFPDEQNQPQGYNIICAIILYIYVSVCVCVFFL